MRERNHRVERELRDIAVKAAGMVQDYGISAFADHRALPGGVRRDMDAFTEVREELSDAWNYLRWGAERQYDAYLAGDPTAADEYEWHMRAMTDLLRLWRTLHTRAA